MTDWEVAYREGITEKIQDRAALEALLDQFQARREAMPFLVDLAGPHGSLTFGVGRADTIVTHTPLQSNPPFHVSRGDGPTGGVVHYYYFGSWTEFGSENVVTWERARKVLLHFYETGKLSSLIEWARG